MFPQVSDYLTHLKTHEKDMASVGGVMLQCNFCDFKSNYFAGFKKHFLMHVKTFTYSCSSCNYKTVRRGDFKRHHLVHTQARPFSCHFCGKNFNHKYNLRTHLLVTHGKNFKKDS